MFDRCNEKDAFQKAVGILHRDPQALAKILRIPPPSPNQQQQQRQHPRETLKGPDGTDWSSVLNLWLGACEASHMVR